MPATHTWKPGVSAYIYDPAAYADGVGFTPGDSLVFNGGTLNAADGTLVSGTYQINAVSASNALYFVNITDAPGAVINVSGPLAVTWADFGTFVNNGVMVLGTPASKGTVNYNLYDNNGSPNGAFENLGTIALQNGSSFNFNQGLSADGAFFNAGPGLMTIGSGSAFTGRGTSNASTVAVFQNDGRVEVDGAAGQVTRFTPSANYQGSGVLTVRGASGDTPSDTIATLGDSATGRIDVSSGELLFNTDFNGGPNVSINFLDGNGLVQDNISLAGGSISTVQTGHPLQATVGGFVAGDAFVYHISYPFIVAPSPVNYSYNTATHQLTLALTSGQTSVLTFTGTYTLSDFRVSLNYDTITVTTTSTANALAGAPPELVTGTSGNDSFVDSPGNHFFRGNGGQDTLTISEGRRGDIVEALTSGDQAIQHGSGNQVDVLEGIADVQFFDGREVFDPNDPAAQMLRLYQAALGRAPDQPGLHQWISNLQAGVPLTALATAFLGSPEFAARFGAGLGTAGFVTALYQNALGRAPDAAGLASWTSQIDGGQMTRAQVLVGFSESAENRANTAGQVAAGIWDVSEAGAEVARLYDTTLGRLPDVGGFSGWVAALNGGASLQSLAGAFVASAEFTSIYGALDNTGFVNALYQNTLHRAADAAGLASWTGALAGGATRAQVVVGFSESTEHKANTAANIISNDPSQYGIKLA